MDVPGRCIILLSASRTIVRRRRVLSGYNTCNVIYGDAAHDRDPAHP